MSSLPPPSKQSDPKRARLVRVSIAIGMGVLFAILCKHLPDSAKVLCTGLGKILAILLGA